MPLLSRLALPLTTLGRCAPQREATAQTPSTARPATTAAPAIATPGHKRLSFQSKNNREGEAATVRAHQPPPVSTNTILPQQQEQ